MALLRKRAIWTGLAVYVAASALLVWWYGREPEAIGGGGPWAAEPAGGEVKLSLLAVGDTGQPSLVPALASGQLAVARGMQAVDREHPVDALVLLGDHFYPDGLPADEILERVRAHLVRPYCPFVALRGPRSREVLDLCPQREAEEPRPIYAVPGNHDYGRPESIALQRDEVSAWISNWRFAAGGAEVVELGSGVSLVLADSVHGRRNGADAIRDALARSRGPWRILALHHPVTASVEGHETSLQRGLVDSGVPVQLVMSGHRHNLQIGVTPSTLHVIAGGGSGAKPFEGAHARRFGLESTGFARIDLVGEGGAQRLVATLYATPRHAFYAWREPRAVARWQVDRRGRALQELPPPPPKSADSSSSSSSTR